MAAFLITYSSDVKTKASKVAKPPDGGLPESEEKPSEGGSPEGRGRLQSPVRQPARGLPGERCSGH